MDGGVDKRHQRSKLIQELCESEARYAHTLKCFSRVAEQCLWNGWTPGLSRRDADLALDVDAEDSGKDVGASAEDNATSKEERGYGDNRTIVGKVMKLKKGRKIDRQKQPSRTIGDPEVWCLRQLLEQLAALSESSVMTMARAMRDSGGDRIGKTLARMTDLFFLYEQYAAMYALIKRKVDEWTSNPGFAAEFRARVLVEREILENRQVGVEHARIRLCAEDVSVHMPRAMAAAASQAQLPTSLASFLIMPIQRVPRYELLLEQILEASKGIQDHTAWLTEETQLLTKVFERVRETAARMDAAIHTGVTFPFSPSRGSFCLSSPLPSCSTLGSDWSSTLFRSLRPNRSSTFGTASSSSSFSSCCSVPGIDFSASLRGRGGTDQVGFGMQMLFESEQRFVSGMQVLEEAFAMPLLKLVYQSSVDQTSSHTDSFHQQDMMNIADSPRSRTSEGGRGEIFTASTNISRKMEHWLSKLGASETGKLQTLVRHGGLVLLCMSIVQVRGVSEHILSQLELFYKGTLESESDLADVLLWISSLVRLFRGYDLACLTCVNTLCEFAQAESAEWSVALSGAETVQSIFPASFWSSAHAMRKLLSRRKDIRATRIQQFVEECQRVGFDGMDLSDLLRMPLERSEQYRHLFGRLVMMPERWRSRRSDFVAAMQSASRSQVFLNHWRNCRALAVGLVLARQAVNARQSTEEEGVGEEDEEEENEDEENVEGLGQAEMIKSPLIRFGVLYRKKKTVVTWLFSDTLLLGFVKSSAVMSPKAGKEKGLYVVSCKQIKLRDVASVLCESSTSTIQLSKSVILRVPSPGEAFYWSIPCAKPEGLFDTWARDVSDAKVRSQYIH